MPFAAIGAGIAVAAGATAGTAALVGAGAALAGAAAGAAFGGSSTLTGDIFGAAGGGGSGGGGGSSGGGGLGSGGGGGGGSGLLYNPTAQNIPNPVTSRPIGGVGTENRPALNPSKATEARVSTAREQPAANDEKVGQTPEANDIWAGRLSHYLDYNTRQLG